eukprot:scaffold5159_cov254-Ochromonas_danica.AAC.2
MHALYLTVLALSFLAVVLAYVPNGWVTRTPRLASQKLFLSEKLSEFQMSIDEIKSELDLRGVDYQHRNEHGYVSSRYLCGLRRKSLALSKLPEKTTFVLECQ